MGDLFTLLTSQDLRKHFAFCLQSLNQNKPLKKLSFRFKLAHFAQRVVNAQAKESVIEILVVFFGRKSEKWNLGIHCYRKWIIFNN